MNVGDRVFVKNPKLKTFREEGIIRDLHFLSPEKYCEVQLESGKYITIKESNLKLLTSQPKDTSMSIDNQRYIAYVHYHDANDNPTSIDEVMARFDEDEIAEPNLVIFGTKEEVLKRIIDDGEYATYAHTFILIGNEVYPVEQKLFVNW